MTRHSGRAQRKGMGLWSLQTLGKPSRRSRGVGDENCQAERGAGSSKEGGEVRLARCTQSVYTSRGPEEDWRCILYRRVG
eukprot:6194353-Pleurochrysis_carterae.AAC.1